MAHFTVANSPTLHWQHGTTNLTHCDKYNMAHFTVANSPTLHYNMVQQTWHAVISTVWPTLQSKTLPTLHYNSTTNLTHCATYNMVSVFSPNFRDCSTVQQTQHTGTHTTWFLFHWDTYNMVSFSLGHIQHGFFFTGTHTTWFLFHPQIHLFLETQQHNTTNSTHCDTYNMAFFSPTNWQISETATQHNILKTLWHIQHGFLFTHKLTHLETEHIVTQQYTLSVHVLSSSILTLTW